MTTGRALASMHRTSSPEIVYLALYAYLYHKIESHAKFMMTGNFMFSKATRSKHPYLTQTFD